VDRIDGLRRSGAQVKFLLGYHESPWTGAILAALRPFGRASSSGHPALLLGQLPRPGNFPRRALADRTITARGIRPLAFEVPLASH